MAKYFFSLILTCVSSLLFYNTALNSALTPYLTPYSDRSSDTEPSPFPLFTTDDDSKNSNSDYAKVDHSSNYPWLSLIVDQNNHIKVEKQDGSESKPYSSLQRALDEAESVSKSGEFKAFIIHIKSGTYLPDKPNRSFTIKNDSRIALSIEGDVTIGLHSNSTKDTPCILWKPVTSTIMNMPSLTITSHNGRLQVLGDIVVQDTCKDIVPLKFMGELFGDFNIRNKAELSIKNAVIHGSLHAPKANLFNATKSHFQASVNIHGYGIISSCKFENGMYLHGKALNDRLLKKSGIYRSILSGHFDGIKNSIFLIDTKTNRSFSKKHAHLGTNVQKIVEHPSSENTEHSSYERGVVRPPQFTPITLFVDGETKISQDEQNGASDKPFRSLQKALDKAAEISETTSEVGFCVFIKKGIYHPENEQNSFEIADVSIIKLVALGNVTISTNPKLKNSEESKNQFPCISWTPKSKYMGWTPSLYINSFDNDITIHGNIEIQNSCKKSARLFLNCDLYGNLLVHQKTRLVIKNSSIHGHVNAPKSLIWNSQLSNFYGPVEVLSYNHIYSCKFYDGMFLHSRANPDFIYDSRIIKSTLYEKFDGVKDSLYIVDEWTNESFTNNYAELGTKPKKIVTR